MKQLLRSPVAKMAIGLLIGIGLLLVVSRFVNIAATLSAVQHHLETPRGVSLALLAGLAFLLAFSIRGIRWRLFLEPVCEVSIGKAIRLFLVSIFINFLLPISGGDLAKTLMLKRIAGVPIGRSLPTVAMDRSMDLLPALVILVLVPLLGMQMDVKLWLVLYTVSGLLLGLVGFSALTVWKRSMAIALLHKSTILLPRTLGSKMESFATGFVDSLLAGVSRPHIFLPAIGLTCLAVTCDSLFALFAFWTIGLPISFGTVVFGYTIYNLFFIFPTPPGQIGSNEAVGLLVFTGLLHLPADKVAAMFIFSHPWAALLMTIAGLICLKTLGLTLSTTMTMKMQPAGQESEEVFVSEEQKVPTGLV